MISQRCVAKSYSVGTKEERKLLKQVPRNNQLRALGKWHSEGEPQNLNLKENLGNPNFIHTLNDTVFYSFKVFVRSHPSFPLGHLCSDAPLYRPVPGDLTRIPTIFPNAVFLSP